MTYDDWKTTPPDEEPPPRCSTCDEHECRCPDEPKERAMMNPKKAQPKIEESLLRNLAILTQSDAETTADGRRVVEVAAVEAMLGACAANLATMLPELCEVES